MKHLALLVLIELWMYFKYFFMLTPIKRMITEWYIPGAGGIILFLIMEIVFWCVNTIFDLNLLQ